MVVEQGATAAREAADPTPAEEDVEVRAVEGEASLAADEEDPGVMDLSLITIVLAGLMTRDPMRDGREGRDMATTATTAVEEDTATTTTTITDLLRLLRAASASVDRLLLPTTATATAMDVDTRTDRPRRSLPLLRMHSADSEVLRLPPLLRRRRLCRLIRTTVEEADTDTRAGMARVEEADRTTITRADVPPLPLLRCLAPETSASLSLCVPLLSISLA